MNDMGKVLMVVGGAIAVLGLVLWLGGGRSWFGRLPGDINVSRGNVGFYFPLMTCILLSVLLSGLLWLFRR